MHNTVKEVCDWDHNKKGNIFVHKTWGMIYLSYVSAKANMKERPLGERSNK
jgi:hypothetical protein